MTFFHMARTVYIADKSKTDPQIVELLKTSPQSFTVPNLKQGQNKLTFNPDTAGPLSLGVAASRKAEGGEARVVVIGNSTFAANPYAGLQKNGALFYKQLGVLV